MCLRPKKKKKNLQSETSSGATGLLDFKPVLWHRSLGCLWRGAGSGGGMQSWRLFAQHPVCFPAQNNDLSGACAFQPHGGLLCSPDSSPDYLEACQAVRFSLRSLLFLPNRHETVQSIIFYLSSHCVSLLLISLGGFDCRKSEGRLRSEKFSQMLSASEMLLRERPPSPWRPEPIIAAMH